MVGRRGPVGAEVLSAPAEVSSVTPGAVCTASGVVVTVAAPAAVSVRAEWTPTVGLPAILTPLERVDDVWWSGLLPGAGLGTRYGLRADGPYAPRHGLVFNPRKLLVDPYAHALDGPVRWHRDLCAARDPRPGHDRSPHPADSGRRMPRAIVTSDDFDWQHDAPLRTPWARTVIYEAHVKALTMLHPEVPPELRGRYLGLAHPAITDYLRALGVTAVQLLPVQQAGLDRPQVQRRVGLHWGYSPVLFAAPDGRFASAHDGAQLTEFRAMVRALHAAGLEVLLDVVFNHTAEADAAGAVLSLRGLADHRTYLRDAEGRYLDTTGCGHTVAACDPLTSRLILDSLRWWVETCHVDGFRFDLASALSRDALGVREEHPLFSAMLADPVLRTCKLIAEPWDLGTGGYRLGGFPAPMAEWNDRARDGLRRFWLGGGTRGELARRLAGSDDVFGVRGPQAGITYVAAHDGFTLHDLLRYRMPRTAANGERGADALHAATAAPAGHDPDGPSPEPEVEAMRSARARALLGSALLGLGVPMLAQGDERQRTQLGNANAYCHDSPLTWVDWTATPASEACRQAVVELLAARRSIDALAAGGWWRDPVRHVPDSIASAAWYDEDGTPLDAEAWDDPHGGLLVLRLDAGRAVHVIVCARVGGGWTARWPEHESRRWRILADTSGRAVNDDGRSGCMGSGPAVVVLEGVGD